MQVHSQVVWRRGGVVVVGHCRLFNLWGGGGGGGWAVAVKKGSIPIGYRPEQGGGGSLAMGQIREYKGPQSAFRPDAKKIKLDGGRT